MPQVTLSDPSGLASREGLMEEARSSVHLTGLSCPLLCLVSTEILRAAFSLSLHRLNLSIFPSHAGLTELLCTAGHDQCWRLWHLSQGCVCPMSLISPSLKTASILEIWPAYTGLECPQDQLHLLW